MNGRTRTVADKIQVSVHSDMPVYRQIVNQLSFMVETGDLRPGQVLPGARLLAEDLRINRNTVARAYAELGEIGLVEGRGRTGTFVVGPGLASADSRVRERARRILESCIRECVALGLSAVEVQSLVLSIAVRAESDLLKVSFVESDAGRAQRFAAELEVLVGVKVNPLVLGRFEPEEERANLVLTTFPLLAEARALMRRPETEVVAVVVALHVPTLVRIASVAEARVVGVWCGTHEQGVTVRDSLRDVGVENVQVLDGLEDADLEGIDIVVVPEESTELTALLDQKAEVIQFGYVLDAASTRMVGEVVRDMQANKRNGTSQVD
ncbi:GntR family transcriptional regulator [Jiangella alba]|uniref:GntR family transcriptional regulator n=1 Tax=Jiangella alba TaxID=561176 RepID=UPI001C0BA674|nr:GntR family transcriptional regulator [Jiangella alba]